MEVETEAGGKTLDDGDGAALGACDAGAASAAALEGLQGASVDAEGAQAELVVEGEEEAEWVGEGQDPLSDGDMGKDVIDEVGGAFDRASSAAAGAEAAPLAGEGDEALVRAVVAADAGEALCENAAADEVALVAPAVAWQWRMGGMVPGCATLTEVVVTAPSTTNGDTTGAPNTIEGSCQVGAAPASNVHVSSPNSPRVDDTAPLERRMHREGTALRRHSMRATAGVARADGSHGAVRQRVAGRAVRALAGVRGRRSTAPAFDRRQTLPGAAGALGAAPAPAAEEAGIATSCEEGHQNEHHPESRLRHRRTKCSARASAPSVLRHSA